MAQADAELPRFPSVEPASFHLRAAMKHRCKHPPKHVVAVIGFLREIGAEIREVVCTKCHRLTFTVHGRHFALFVRLSSSAADAVRSAKITVHRMLTRAGLHFAAAT